MTLSKATTTTAPSEMPTDVAPLTDSGSNWLVATLASAATPATNTAQRSRMAPAAAGRRRQTHRAAPHASGMTSESVASRGEPATPPAREMPRMIMSCTGSNVLNAA